MAKLPGTFDRRKSLPHIQLLSHFLKPREIVLSKWSYFGPFLKEEPSFAIEHFIRDGSLVPCNAEEKLDRLFSVPQLKAIAKEEGINVSGTKADLIARLMAAVPEKAERLVASRQVVKCSGEVVDFITQHEQKKREGLELAKSKAFDALKRTQAKEAYKCRLEYEKKYSYQEGEARTYIVEELNFILTSAPKVLGQISQSDLRDLSVRTHLNPRFFEHTPS